MSLRKLKPPIKGGSAPEEEENFFNGSYCGKRTRVTVVQKNPLGQQTSTLVANRQLQVF
jgi:hypothetical protein